MNSSVNATKVRIDYSRVNQYVMPEYPKQSFWQKLGQGFGRAVSFSGKMAAAVLPFALPGIGLPLAAGSYGVSQLADLGLQSSSMKRRAEIASTPQPNNIGLPGLFGTATGDQGEVATEFIAPHSLAPDIGDVIIRREQTRSEAEARL